MVRNTDEQEDDDILEENVVRPDNHKWCVQGGEKTATWILKSTECCPTYGYCILCYISGPVGKTCMTHMDMTYRVILTSRQYILDSKTLAAVIGMGLEITKANRK